LIELSGVSRIYRGPEGPVAALSGVDLKVSPGDYLAITGPSGSGKTTLLMVIGLVESTSGGMYRLEGRDTASFGRRERASLRARTFGFVLQGGYLLPELTALENVILPMRYGPWPRRVWRRRAAELLEFVGLSHRASFRAFRLSGGERQRVALARALANDPPVLLADEPTAFLDSESRERVLELFDRLHREGRTLLVVTHDPAVAERARRRFRLYDGRLRPA